jgi:hypothetical protein
MYCGEKNYDDDYSRRSNQFTKRPWYRYVLHVLVLCIYRYITNPSYRFFCQLRLVATLTPKV